MYLVRKKEVAQAKGRGVKGQSASGRTYCHGQGFAIMNLPGIQGRTSGHLNGTETFPQLGTTISSDHKM